MRFTRVIATAASVAALLATSPAAAGAQMCTGDCGQDGHVTIPELITMVNIALMSAPLSRCAAGDRNGDDKVMIDELIAAVGFALTSCPSGTPSPTPADVTLRIGSATGTRGQVVSFSVTIGTAGRSVDVTQNEIPLAANAPIASNAAGEPACTSTTGALAATFLPVGCSTTPPCTSTRFTYARQQVADGTVLYTCNATISAAAPSGPIDVDCQNASWANIDVQAAAICSMGTIVVQ